MPAAHQLRSIKSFKDLITFLQDELDWPLDEYGFDDLTFSYQPAELGLRDEQAAKVKTIHQLRPLSGSQPWGIFFIEFENKRLPVTVLRRILSHLVVKKRASANKAERAAWQAGDLMFISAYGDEQTDQREIAFAHFHQAEGDLPTLRVLGWDGADTPLKLEHVAGQLKQKLCWPDDPADADAWREQWRSPFRHRIGHVIRTADNLAEVLAMLAKRIRSAAHTLLEAENERGALTRLYEAFRAALIHDLTPETFGDTYAQTITYGLLTAAISRTEMSDGRHGTVLLVENVTDMVPVTNPFLKEMLQEFLRVGGRKGAIDFDELGIQDVVDLLRGEETDLPAILRDFGNRTRGEDPVIHFYEHFLSAYNKRLKVQRGVFYTPQPVVSYIVRSVHELLQTEFGLEDGLASTVTWGEMLNRHPGMKLPPLTDEPGEERTISPDEPFVQILDIATGTATFLVEVIDVIFKHLKAKWDTGGAAAMPAIENRKSKIVNSFADYWNLYVPEHLLPRLHGFELMMAPYAIAHMKFGLKLKETGFTAWDKLDPQRDRVRIYLTNVLEPKVKQLPQIGFEPLAHEAKAVNEIKWYKRFTVVIGNPPYSNFGQLNRIPFVLGLLEDYKRGLDEKKLNLDDDFIKFIRLSQHILHSSGIGILGMISNSVFIDGITHRRMRESLLEAFSRICVLDLHGSSKKFEVSPDGSKDENIFDIQQGVGIILAAQTHRAQSSQLGWAELWGSRDSKYRALTNDPFGASIPFVPLEPKPPLFFFVPKDFGLLAEYETFVPVPEMFLSSGPGVKTERDTVSIHRSKEGIVQAVEDFRSQPDDALREKYGLTHDSRDWKIANARKDVKANTSPELFQNILYRPFDWRFTWYSGQTRGFIGTPGARTMRQMLKPGALGLIVKRQARDREYDWFLVTNGLLIDGVFSIDSKGRETLFPLYQGVADAQKSLFESNSNLAPEFTEKVHKCLGQSASELTALQIFRYTYAVFHSPGYRSRYAEFLKIDFPRLPLTGNLELFRALARLGGELVALHLLESPKLEKPITELVGTRSTASQIIVQKTTWSNNTVWLDKAQTIGFKGVREDVWNFHIGGYQVCEKWLKDRGPKKGKPGRTLTRDDITHYHKIVVALSETIRLMKEIDKVIEQHGGWPLK